MFWGEIVATETSYNLYIESREEILQIFVLQGTFKEQMKLVNRGITVCVQRKELLLGFSVP
jgi:hypothetical protein